MQIWSEGSVINPLRKRNHKIKPNPDYLIDDNHVTFTIGEVIRTYDTDWNFQSNQIDEIADAIRHVINDMMELTAEDVTDFSVIETYDNREKRNIYEIRIVVNGEVAKRLKDYYSD